MQITSETSTTNTAGERDLILSALDAFASQRPNMDPHNYIRSWDDADGRKAYATDRNTTSRDLQDARALLRRVRRSGITEDQLKYALRHAFSGRLSWDGRELDYCVGSYWSLEFRAAVCAVLSSALWAYYRDDCHCETADKIRAAARRDFPRSLVARWFR